MNNNLLAQIILRLIRNKNKNIIWVCDSIGHIISNFDNINDLNINCEFIRSQNLIKFPNGLRIHFILNDNRADKLAGINIDEVIIDENGD